MRTFYDIIVIGGGHAGTEAAWAAASALSREHGEEPRVALITMNPARIGQMSCNPAIGGLAKGQMVREIDALGGMMGRAIDATGIMFKMLNTSKGPAVRGPRAQADKYAYAAEIQRLLSTRDNIDVIAGTVEDIIVENNVLQGVTIPADANIVHADPRAIDHNIKNAGRARPVYPERSKSHNNSEKFIRAGAVVLTTGTFMRGLMHTGENRTEGGRVGEQAAVGISATLQKLGFELGRLKTGTPPRLNRESIDWDALQSQRADEQPIAFSDMSPDVLPEARFPHLPQIECRLTQTTPEAHDAIRSNLHRAPMFSGQITAETGPRYCPSIEDKVVKFEDRDSHHVFLEPESLHSNEIYCNGISTSLPFDVQEQIVRTMPGCANAEILRWGYAVEYDMVWPHQIDATGAAKHIDGFFLAGQINCTTGYEEAGGQGVVAGLNAARYALNEDPLRVGRDLAYIGVMMDDLVTKTPREPYRMFTSRAEHRLLLRADNADERLTPIARELGLIDDERWRAFEHRRAQLDAIRNQLDQRTVDGKRLRDLARRPTISVDEIAQHIDGKSDHRMIERVLTDVKYEGYIARQRAEIKRQADADRQRIPDWLDYRAIPGLRAEAAEVLAQFQPKTMGQASRLAGVNPADLTLIAVAIRRGPPAQQRTAVSI